MVRSLQWKLIMVMMLMMMTVMAIVGVYLVNSLESYHENEFYEKMTSVFTTEFIESMQARASGEEAGQRLYDYVSAYSVRLGLSSGRVFSLLSGSDGSLIATTGELSGVARTPNIIAAINGEVGMDSSSFSGYFDLALPIKGESGDYIVYIRDDRESLASLQWMIFSILLQALLFGLAIAVVLSIVLSKAISRPLERLTESAQSVAAGDFTDRPPVYSNDEIGVLTTTFNSMSRALEDTISEVENEKNKLNTMFQHMTDGVVAFDGEGSLLHINGAAVGLLGVEGGSFEELFGGNDPSLEEVLTLEYPDFAERMLEKGERTLRLFFAPFGTEHEKGVITVIYDMTEQHRLDTSRREFVADISHELRTPMTNIKSYAETIIADDNIPISIRNRFLQVIINETDRMSRLVRDLMTISKLDYGRMDWTMSVFDPAVLVRDMTDAMKAEASRRSHTLTLEEGGALPSVRGDRDRVGQVVANVVGNALKYTPEGGLIKVRTAPEDGGAAIYVSDNGIGIPKDDIPHLFERFYRVDKARSRESGGSGLGLSIAKEFVGRMNGSISLESELGSGTTVRIWLPAADGEEKV